MKKKMLLMFILAFLFGGCAYSFKYSEEGAKVKYIVKDGPTRSCGADPAPSLYPFNVNIPFAQFSGCQDITRIKFSESAGVSPHFFMTNLCNRTADEGGNFFYVYEIQAKPHPIIQQSNAFMFDVYGAVYSCPEDKIPAGAN